MEERREIDLRREYTKDIHDEDEPELYPVLVWNNIVDSGMFGNYNGSGYWVKDSKISDDEVFHSPQLDATHVIWYSK